MTRYVIDVSAALRLAKEGFSVPDVTNSSPPGSFCQIPSPDGTPHYKEGFIGLFDVVAAL